jgi:molybdenum cofactor cytidylyltransferase
VGKLVYVVLAAGSSKRMGFAKATAPLAGKSPLERLRAILGGRTVAIVTNEELRSACMQTMPSATVLVNRAPALGMTSSLIVAHRELDPAATLGVLLADKPFVREETLDLCEAALEEAPDCDVLFPTAAGENGHPVYFAPSARARLSALPGGDTLRDIRDDPRLRQIAVESFDPGVLIDLDTPDAWRTAERRLMAEQVHGAP